MTRSFTVHHRAEAGADTGVPDPHQDTFSKTIIGFWTYLMTDCLLFGTLFLAYAVLHNQTFGGPTSKELYDIPTVFVQTLALLLSSVTCGMALLAAINDKREQVIGWLIATFFLGAAFIAIELHEFYGLVQEGYTWKRSAFLSSFFSLVGTHGLHVSCGLIWMAVMMAQVIWQGITINTFRRLVVFGLFWHFIDLIWIFVFTIVYLMGVI